MAYVSKTDAGKKSIFQGRDRSKCLDGFTLMTLQPVQYLKNLPLFSISQNHKLHLRLTQQNNYDFSTLPHCERPDGETLTSFQEKSPPVFQTGQQTSQSQGSKGCRSGSAPEEREQLQTESSCLAWVQEKFPVLPGFSQFFRKFSHSTRVQNLGCSYGLSQQTSQRRWSWTTALNLQHPESTSLAAAGEPWAKIQNRRQKTSQWKEFPISKGQSGCRNKFLIVLSAI